MEESKKRELKSLKYTDDDGTIKIGSYLSVLPIGDTDVIRLKRFDGLTTDMVDMLSRWLGDNGRTKCLIVIVDRMSDISTLDEEQMAKYGWYRHEQE